MFGTARNAAPVFRPWFPFLPNPTRSRRCLLSRFEQKLRQLCDIRRDPPRPDLRSVALPLSECAVGRANHLIAGRSNVRIVRPRWV
jgi:hypothetical protein